MAEPTRLQHGGRLREAARQYNIPLADWLDLSTGINPTPWPVPPLPTTCWQRLPEENDGLEDAAAAYYGNTNLLPVAGSQAALQWLPYLLPRAAISCLGPLYGEHPQAWQRAGHKVRQLPYGNLSRALTAATPYVLFCNPNNPTAEHHPQAAALDLAAKLKQRGGWLIVDEAFIDATPDNSLTHLAGTVDAPNLIVFRSLGKFFGLAGARVGFLFAAAELRAKLTDLLGPWPLSGPARAASQLALQDHAWQTRSRQSLSESSHQLAESLAPFGSVRACALFATLHSPSARQLHDFLARRGILTRLFPDQDFLRFGLPASAAEGQRLSIALKAWQAADLA